MWQRLFCFTMKGSAVKNGAVAVWRNLIFLNERVGWVVFVSERVGWVVFASGGCCVLTNWRRRLRYK